MPSYLLLLENKNLMKGGNSHIVNSCNTHNFVKQQSRTSIRFWKSEVVVPRGSLVRSTTCKRSPGLQLPGLSSSLVASPGELAPSLASSPKGPARPAGGGVGVRTTAAQQGECGSARAPTHSPRSPAAQLVRHRSPHCRQ